MNEWSSVRYLDDDGDGYGGVPFVELSEVVRRMDEHAATVERLRAALTIEDEIAHGEAWDDERKACAYCGGGWLCFTQRAIHRALAARSESQP